jgi:hypothetical protein
LVPIQPDYWERETASFSRFIAVRLPPADLPWLLTTLRAASRSTMDEPTGRFGSDPG